MTGILAKLAMAALMCLISGWVMMVGVGVVHAEWLPMLPTVGYWTALLFSVLLLARTAIGVVLKAAVDALNRDDR